MHHVAVMGVCLDVDEAVAMETVVGVIIRSVGMHGADGPSVELVKSAMVGARSGVVAVEVPFIDEAGAVAGGFHYIGDGGVGG